jgi:subtilisin family serine protease
MPDELYPHIPWKRLRLEEKRGKPKRPAVPPRIPLRPDQSAHGGAVAQRVDEAIQAASVRRQTSGIDPTRLLVLELDFLHTARRELLERLGVQIIEEAEIQVPVNPPFYEVPLRFHTARHLETFAGSDGLTKMGMREVLAARKSDGEIDPVRLSACFEDRESALSFWSDKDAAEAAGYEVGQSRPIRVSRQTRHRLLVQFDDRSTLERFRREVEAYRRKSGKQALPVSERNQLFDALEDVRALGPDDRIGERLGSEGPPASPEFAIDVDLWHPGSPRLVGDVIRAFRDPVNRAGGRVTDGPTTVAETLLLARAKGNAAMLEAILGYDRVARADLPPLPTETPLTIFTDGDAPDAPEGLPAPDGPIACVVDSGVVAGHPLLAGLVVDEHDFDSGEGTPVDHAGHGTYIAGIVAYGDVDRCLQERSWLPSVLILSAKVLRSSPGGIAIFPEDSDKRVETQLREATTYFARERGCRVFNLSLGHRDRQYGNGRQLPWALTLDELANDLDVVLVVSAGNVVSPVIPACDVSEQFQPALREQLLGPDHALTDPATAVNALTVGAIVRRDVPRQAFHRREERPPLIGSPKECPAPYTRAGLLESTGGGTGRTVKPELVAYGGNYCLGLGGQSWFKNDYFLGEPSLNHAFRADGRLLKSGTGTSVATAFVSHVCSLVEHRLRTTPNRTRPPSANLIRALVVHSASVSSEARAWIENNAADGVRRRLRLLGYGMPNVTRALHSSDQRTLLTAEDTLDDGYFHVYELDLPDEFRLLRSKRWIRITLAYDPPVKGTRKDYVRRRLFFRLVRGSSLAEIRDAASQGKELKQVSLEPGCDLLKGSTIQSAVFEGSRPSAFGAADEGGEPVAWHVVVRSEPRLETDLLGPQRYALVASLEHTEPAVRIYNRVRQRVELRQRVQWP